MKKLLVILLSCLMVAALFAGCKPKTETPEAGGESGAEGAAAVPDATDIVRLESIDYDEATGGLILSLTKGSFVPSTTEEEYEYNITYGDTVTMPLSKDATIDFPMAEDLAKSVTITAEELTEEFLAFVKEFNDKPLFTITQEGDAVKTMTYFYLP